MRNLINARQRKESHSTLYFEFQKGPWQKKHWLEDSVYLHADRFDELGLFALFSRALPCFYYYYVTEITPPQFERIRSLAPEYGDAVAGFVEELASHVGEWLRSEGVFTVCGI